MAASSEPDGEQRHQDRDESQPERLDRNIVDLVNELRVAGTGIQVIFAFLLVIPFDSRFATLSSFQRDLYFVTLLCIATAATLLIAPSVHHRLLFRQGQRDYIVRLGTRYAIVAAVFLAVGITGILVLISDLLFGALTAGIVGAITATLVTVLWFAVPLRHRYRAGQPRTGP